MLLRHRVMRPYDIRECVDILASHPVIGPRYGPTIEHLPETWLRLLQYEAGNAWVFYAEEGSRAPICFFGVTAMVQDDFVAEIKKPPQFWIGSELTRRMMKGESPVLTDRQLREANSCSGLNLLCWESCGRPGYEAHSELQRYMMLVFIDGHRGYLLKEVISTQTESPERLGFHLKTGGYLWDPLMAGYTSTLRKDPGEIASKPHVVGITRDLQLKRHGDWAGSWVGTLFDYQPPALGLSRSQRRLLSFALLGATDEHLAEVLGTSLPAVKKTWVSVYRRVEDHLPELLSDPPGSDIPIPANGRGREKRRRLLAYLREHPEELRPVSRRLLSKAAQA